MKIDYEKILNSGLPPKKLLASLVTSQRYIHCLSTAGAARQFAVSFGADPALAETAGLYHDIAKDIPLCFAQRLSYPEWLKPDKQEYRHKGLIHGSAGATILYNYAGFDNRVLLEAIRYHVTGRPSPSPIEKTLYLADICEPNRDFEEFEFITELAVTDAELAVVVWIAIKYVLVESLGRSPHHRTKRTLISFPKARLKEAARIIGEQGLGTLSL